MLVSCCRQVTGWVWASPAHAVQLWHPLALAHPRAHPFVIVCVANSRSKSTSYALRMRKVIRFIVKWLTVLPHSTVLRGCNSTDGIRI